MSLARTVQHLWPYVWPADRFDLRLRACLALSMMLIAKLVTLLVPFSFKWVTDALVEESTGDVVATVLTGAIMLTIIYGILRALMQLFTQARDALFAFLTVKSLLAGNFEGDGFEHR
jgi:ATP-binding cassette subfamily B protein